MQIPSFFRVLMGDFCQQLCIPSDFTKYLDKRLLGKCAAIRDPSGKSWPVGVNRREDGFYFQSGWQEFVKYHFLEAGDFIVFDYDGKSHFSAKIYGSSACEKDEGLAKGNSDASVSLAKKANQLLTPKVEVDEVEPQVHEETCKKEVFNSNKVPSDWVLCGKKFHVDDDEQKPPIDSTSSFKPKNSCFQAYFLEHRRNRMTIPRELAKEKGLLNKKSIVLQDVIGRSWPVRLAPQLDGRVLMRKGFCDFCNGNQIEAGNTLIFEFIEPTVLKVNIIPVGLRRRSIIAL
ncbi:hypothetical protein FNV43_RR11419 [Rhamnella rubrinervis]|uniref:TF-B3 domain-containing protein n=1 Tax=Rhamnella rubrinervis TaxID=2594499 RepID=A0A8K0MHU8_9ROSA|nr:hypothetical protein FNV43_RR11419 [Rhamnella rubrinervis]